MTWVLGLGESYDLCLPPFNEPTSARRKNGEHTKRRRWISSFVFLSLFFFFFFLVVGKTSICLMLKAHKLIKGLILFFDMHFYSEGSNDAYYYDLLYIPDPRD